MLRGPKLSTVSKHISDMLPEFNDVNVLVGNLSGLFSFINKHAKITEIRIPEKCCLWVYVP